MASRNSDTDIIMQLAARGKCEDDAKRQSDPPKTKPPPKAISISLIPHSSLLCDSWWWQARKEPSQEPRSRSAASLGRRGSMSHRAESPVLPSRTTSQNFTEPGKTEPMPSSAPPALPRVFMFSSVKSDAALTYKHAVQKLGARVSDSAVEFDPECTHMVVGHMRISEKVLLLLRAVAGLHLHIGAVR